MSDPLRLREGDDPFVSEVLASARDDAPGAHVGKRVRAALGVERGSRSARRPGRRWRREPRRPRGRRPS